MLLTITTTHRPATDLGYLLHKNPARAQEVEMPFGKAHVFYPEVTEDRCTAAVLLEIDPVRLVRGAGGFDQYVNDRPYASSSYLSSALSELFGTAMGGRSKERQELADRAIQLEARLPVLPCRGGEGFLRRLFEPLGYEVAASRLPLDEQFQEWGESPYFDVTLSGEMRIADLLGHLYVLVPVLDNEKHYWVDESEVEKLLRKGKAWLGEHPEREEIARRYLRHQRHLTREALARLSAADGDPEPDEREAEAAGQEERIERPISLHDQRLNKVHETLKGSKRVLDLGCGEGRLLRLLMNDLSFEEVVGMDVSVASLEKASLRLRLDKQPERVARRISLIHGSLLYRDNRLAGFDGAALVEVIEHLDPPRLRACERTVFEFAKPAKVVVTTPNREYNALFETLPQGQMRHRDHRFEWTRAEFEDWALRVATEFGYEVRCEPIGLIHEEHGGPSQMAVFTRGSRTESEEGR